MPGKSPALRLHDICGAILHTETIMRCVSPEQFADDLTRRRVVERNIEIISEASRRLPDTLKARYPEIPWKDIAGIGNVLRHDYENVIPDALWKVAREHLPILEAVCRAELATLQTTEQSDADRRLVETLRTEPPAASGTTDE